VLHALSGVLSGIESGKRADFGFDYFDYCVYFENLESIIKMNINHSRLDPSELSPEDFREVDRLLAEVLGSERHAIVSGSGERLALPEPVFDLLMDVLRSVRDGRAVVVLPEDESFTSQAAADYLGMSRPFLISLLDKDAIPFHRVGTHRRILFKDLLDYEKNRDTQRREAMNALFKQVRDAGLDDAAYTGE
jgi:excisionase family DNA binding protein